MSVGRSFLRLTSAAGRAAGCLLLLGAQAERFSYAGIGLHTDLKALAARYPHSQVLDTYIHVAPRDRHDHISGVAVSGAGRDRRARLAFEIEGPDGSPEYPRCSAVEAELRRGYGAPQEVRRFMEEASPRADRVWRSATEEMTLICFMGPGEVLRAEAVQIAPR